MGGRFQNEEAITMKCHVCGSTMSSMITDLPFKLTEATIVILKEVPVLQCDDCREYLLDDSVLECVEKSLEKADVAAEIEVLMYAA
jgi:YgiT-type zinc finger domain-containing protein